MPNDMDFSHALLSPESASKCLLPALPSEGFADILALLDPSYFGYGGGLSGMPMQATNELPEQQHADSAYASDDDDLVLCLDQAEVHQAEVLCKSEQLKQQRTDITRLRYQLTQVIGEGELQRLESAPRLAARDTMYKTLQYPGFSKEQAPCCPEQSCESFVPEAIDVPVYADILCYDQASMVSYMAMLQHAIERNEAIIAAYVSLCFHARLYHGKFGHAMLEMSGQQTHGHTKQMDAGMQVAPPPVVPESAGYKHSAARSATKRSTAKKKAKRGARQAKQSQAKQSQARAQLLFNQLPQSPLVPLKQDQ